MDEPYRVLVTGSRDWDDHSAVYQELGRIGREVGITRMVVVHGDCPHGADALARQWARTWPVGEERHPAEWRPGGHLDRSAGFRRNAEMVALGANVCLAFIKDGSRGATHCAGLAEKAGIPVQRYTASGTFRPTED